MIEFLLNQTVVRVVDEAPTLSVLDYLRTRKRLTGTKEGCASGDCGACTVLVGGRTPAGVHYQNVNACLLLLGSLHGKHLLTVDGLSPSANPTDRPAHPVQRALIDCHGSQCGFCTPGFVMSMAALYLNEPDYPGDDAVIEALSGNLCRCTGYRPILAACRQMYQYPRQEPAALAAAAAFFAQPIAMQAGLASPAGKFLLPNSLAELMQLLSEHPEATLLAGGTDLVVEFTQQLMTTNLVISLERVAEMRALKHDAQGFEIGAAVPYAEFVTQFCEHYPEATELFQRLGSEQIRNVGTLGGSLANASPIGDPAPLLIALGAELKLVSSAGQRTLPLAEFFTAYRQTVLRPGEVIVAVMVPARRPTQHLCCYKISKRIEDDISSVLLVVSMEFADQKMLNVRCACGGMAATPASAHQTALALEGKTLSLSAINNAQAALAKDFSPLNDVRASSHYRLKVAQNLLQRLYLELQPGNATRVAHAAL